MSVVADDLRDELDKCQEDQARQLRNSTSQVETRNKRIKELEWERDEYKEWHQSANGQVNARNARITTLEEGLKKYGEHEPECHITILHPAEHVCASPGYCHGCTCGLTELIGGE